MGSEMCIRDRQRRTNPQPRNILLLLVPGQACARAAGERRIPPVCTHTHLPTARSGAETPQGGAPASPTLIRSDKKIDIQQRRQQHRHATTGFCFIYKYTDTDRFTYINSKNRISILLRTIRNHKHGSGVAPHTAFNDIIYMPGR